MITDESEVKPFSSFRSIQTVKKCKIAFNYLEEKDIEIVLYEVHFNYYLHLILRTWIDYRNSCDIRLMRILLIICILFVANLDYCKSINNQLY